MQYKSIKLGKKGKQSTLDLKQGIGERPEEKKDRDDELRRKIETKRPHKKKEGEKKERTEDRKSKERTGIWLIQCIFLCNYIHLM